MRVSDLPPRLRLFNVCLETGCWIWTGRKNRNGYGRVCVDGREPVAHRAIYERLVGPIPLAHVLDHLCRRRECVNPRHLEPTTISVNTRRGRAILFKRTTS